VVAPPAVQEEAAPDKREETLEFVIAKRRSIASPGIQSAVEIFPGTGPTFSNEPTFLPKLCEKDILSVFVS
jgi:hypothetical protein